MTSTRPLAWTEPIDPLDRAADAVKIQWEQAHEFVARENFADALDCIESAIELANAGGDVELARRLRCGRAAMELEIDRATDLDTLRDILGAARTTATSYLAAYQLARAFELQHDWKKALFYAQMAQRAAELMEISAWQASAENMLGNVLVAESRFAEAEPHYRAALACCRSARGASNVELDRAQAADNLAFTLCCLHRADEARAHLASALWALRHSEGPARLSVELDAAVLHLQSERGATKALRYANRALALSRRLGDERNESNALLLQVEAGKRTDQPFVVRRALSSLGERFDAEFAAALAHYDVLELVNFHA